MEIVKKVFTPEFRNRLDGIIQFGTLTPETIRTVVDKFLVELQAQLDEKRVGIHVDDAAVDWFVEHGYSESMGARPMARLIQEKLKKEIAEDILFGKLSENGGDVYVSLEGGEISLEVKGRKSKEKEKKELSQVRP
jgi:ATP-dependent Clp protease ATP-binding subunit ClpA